MPRRQYTCTPAGPHEGDDARIQSSSVRACMRACVCIDLFAQSSQLGRPSTQARIYTGKHAYTQALITWRIAVYPRETHEKVSGWYVAIGNAIQGDEEEEQSKAIENGESAVKIGKNNGSGYIWEKRNYTMRG